MDEQAEHERETERLRAAYRNAASNMLAFGYEQADQPVSADDTDASTAPAADTQGTTAPAPLSGASDHGALAAYECLEHPECGPVTALGRSGHGHHSEVTGLWCWHFTDFWAAMGGAEGYIDGDPSIHKTYPTAGPREGYWSKDFAEGARLTRKGVVPAAGSSSKTWRAYGAADAPVAMRAISRALLDEPHLGNACAVAIIEAYGPDMTRVGPGAFSIHLSEERVRLLTSFLFEANRREWEAGFLSAPDDYKSQYRDGFIEGLDQEMANWAARPTHPPTNAEVVAEEKRWQLALMMRELSLGLHPEWVARFLGVDATKERRNWRRFLPGGRG